MPRKSKQDIVDGYSVLKAATRTGARRPARKEREEEKVPDAAAAQVAAHIGHTAMPPRYDLTCFECGYTFTMTGRAAKTFCPKCRTEISLGDVTIDSSFAETVRTGGRVTITEDGVVTGGEITGGEIVLAGRHDDGLLQSVGLLHIRPGAVLSEKLFSARDLRVAEGAVVQFKTKKTFRDVEICGRLKGRLAVEGRLVIQPGGVLEGHLTASHMQIHDGGGLKACVKLITSEKSENLKNLKLET